MTACVLSRRPSFAQDAADVRLDGLLGDDEPGGKLLVRQPLGDQDQHLGLPRA